MSFNKSVKVLWIKAKYTDTDILAVAIWVVEFLNRGYKIRKVLA